MSRFAVRDLKFVLPAGLSEGQCEQLLVAEEYLRTAKNFSQQVTEPASDMSAAIRKVWLEQELSGATDSFYATLETAELTVQVTSRHLGGRPGHPGQGWWLLEFTFQRDDAFDAGQS